MAEDQEDNTRHFGGWFIPAAIVELFDDDDITMTEMILLAEIDSLTRNGKNGVGCFAGNDYLAKKLKLRNPTSVANMITKLKRMGLVRQISFDGRRRYLETRWSHALNRTSHEEMKAEVMTK